MPIAPSQLPTLVVLLHMWNHTKGLPRYVMQTKLGLVPVANLEHAREYAKSHGYTGIKVVPT